MRVNYGKPFERKFAKDWEKAYPNTLIIRLQDSMSGYYGTSRNPCDFICFPGTHCYMLEVKTHYGNTFPWADFRQYDKLIKYMGMPNVVAGVILWMIDHDKVIFVPIETCKQMKDDGLKSININKLQGYKYLELPSTKKRVFLDSDYTVMEDFVNDD